MDYCGINGIFFEDEEVTGRAIFALMVNYIPSFIKGVAKTSTEGGRSPEDLK